MQQSFQILARKRLSPAAIRKLDVRSFLERAYLHPAIKAALAEDTVALDASGIYNLLGNRITEASSRPAQSSQRSNVDNKQYEQTCIVSIDSQSTSTM